MLHKNFNHWYF